MLQGWPCAVWSSTAPARRRETSDCLPGCLPRPIFQSRKTQETIAAQAFPEKRPLYPRKRTCAVHSPVSAMGQKRTLPLFDHSVGALLELQRDTETQRLCCLKIDHEVIF